MPPVAPRIRVLVVDDSTVARRFLSEAISNHPELEVVGTASHGALAVKKLTLLNPDLITMDVEMPEMSGLEALAAIRAVNPRLPIIMVSSLTERGADTTLEALALGATDYVTKPSGGPEGVDREEFVRDLLLKVVTLGRPANRMASAIPRAVPLATAGATALREGVSVLPLRSKSASPHRAVPLTGRVRLVSRIDVVGIGISTGGPNALAELLPALPADLPVPVLVVQHMPPLFTKLLADRLNARSAIQVREAVDGEPLLPGTAYIAPGNYHMVLSPIDRGHTIRLTQDPLENSCRPAVDVTYRSLNACFGPHVLAVVMTGMGQDGLRGCELIRESEGQVMVQDQKSSVVWGMPGYVAEAGLADEVLPLQRLAAAMVQRLSAGRQWPAQARRAEVT